MEIRDPTLAVSIIRSNSAICKFTLRSVPDKPGVAAQILKPIAEHSLSVDLIVQTPSDGGRTDFTFTLDGDEADAAKVDALLRPLVQQWGSGELTQDNQLSKITLIGSQMQAEVGVAAKAFAVLAAKNVNIEAISTSSIRITILVRRQDEDLAMRTLMETFIKTD